MCIFCTFRYFQFAAAFKKTKETFGGIDIVVNNAGVGGENDDNWERCIDINMVGNCSNILNPLISELLYFNTSIFQFVSSKGILKK